MKDDAEYSEGYSVEYSSEYRPKDERGESEALIENAKEGARRYEGRV